MTSSYTVKQVNDKVSIRRTTVKARRGGSVIHQVWSGNKVVYWATERADCEAWVANNIESEN